MLVSPRFLDLDNNIHPPDSEESNEQRRSLCRSSRVVIAREQMIRLLVETPLPFSPACLPVERHGATTDDLHAEEMRTALLNYFQMGVTDERRINSYSPPFPFAFLFLNLFCFSLPVVCVSGRRLDLDALAPKYVGRCVVCDRPPPPSPFPALSLSLSLFLQMVSVSKAKRAIYIGVSNAVLILTVLDYFYTYNDFYDQMNALANSSLFTVVQVNAIIANLMLLWTILTFVFFGSLSLEERAAVQQNLVIDVVEFTAGLLYGEDHLFHAPSILLVGFCIMGYLWSHICETRLQLMSAAEARIPFPVIRLIFFLGISTEVLVVALSTLWEAQHKPKEDHTTTLHTSVFLHFTLLLLSYAEYAVRLAYQEAARAFHWSVATRSEMTYVRRVFRLLESLLFVVLVARIVLNGSQAPLLLLRRLLMHLSTLAQTPFDLYKIYKVSQRLRSSPQVTQDELDAEEVVCTICYEPILRPYGSRRLACSHPFHESCLRQWFEEHSTCPYCRADLLAQPQPAAAAPPPPAAPQQAAGQQHAEEPAAAEANPNDEMEVEIQRAYLEYLNSAALLQQVHQTSSASSPTLPGAAAAFPPSATSSREGLLYMGDRVGILRPAVPPEATRNAAAIASILQQEERQDAVEFRRAAAAIEAADARDAADAAPPGSDAASVKDRRAAARQRFEEAVQAAREQLQRDLEMIEASERRDEGQARGEGSRRGRGDGLSSRLPFMNRIRLVPFCLPFSCMTSSCRGDRPDLIDLSSSSELRAEDCASKRVPELKAAASPEMRPTRADSPTAEAQQASPESAKGKARPTQASSGGGGRVRLLVLLGAAALSLVHYAAAVYLPVADSDETFNFVEPIHFLLYGTGKQTWENCNHFCLRNWAFTVLYALPAVVRYRVLPLVAHAVLGRLAPGWMPLVLGTAGQDIAAFNGLTAFRPVDVYIFQRIAYGQLSCAAQLFFLRSVYVAYEGTVARRMTAIAFALLVTSSAIPHAAVSALPTSFAMLLFFVALGCWMRTGVVAWCIPTPDGPSSPTPPRDTVTSINSRDAASTEESDARELATAPSVVLAPLYACAAVVLVVVIVMVGWPFAGLIAAPMLLDLLCRFTAPVCLTASASVFVTGAIVFYFDSFFYCELAFSSWNIIVYNVLGGGDAKLYGVEPFFFFYKNLLVNFHFVFLLVLVAPLAVLLLPAEDPVRRVRAVPAPRRGLGRFTPADSVITELLYVSSFFIWFIFWHCIPHKEERFMAPAYPSLILSASMAITKLLAIARAAEAPAQMHERTSARGPQRAPKMDAAAAAARPMEGVRRRGAGGAPDAAAAAAEQRGVAPRRGASSSSRIRLPRGTRWVLLACFFGITAALSLSRATALTYFYGAPQRMLVQAYPVLTAAAEHKWRHPGESGGGGAPLPFLFDTATPTGYTSPFVFRVCVGREWYRFPSSFFLPHYAPPPVPRLLPTSPHPVVQYGFLRTSAFSGALPLDFRIHGPGVTGILNYTLPHRSTDATPVIPARATVPRACVCGSLLVNDLNMAIEDQYLSASTCDVVLDSLPSPGSAERYNNILRRPQGNNNRTAGVKARCGAVQQAAGDSPEAVTGEDATEEEQPLSPEDRTICREADEIQLGAFAQRVIRRETFRLLDTSRTPMWCRVLYYPLGISEGWGPPRLALSSTNRNQRGDEGANTAGASSPCMFVRIVTSLSSELQHCTGPRGSNLVVDIPDCRAVPPGSRIVRRLHTSIEFVSLYYRYPLRIPCLHTVPMPEAGTSTAAEGGSLPAPGAGESASRFTATYTTNNQTRTPSIDAAGATTTTTTTSSSSSSRQLTAAPRRRPAPTSGDRWNAVLRLQRWARGWPERRRARRLCGALQLLQLDAKGKVLQGAEAQQAGAAAARRAATDPIGVAWAAVSTLVDACEAYEAALRQENETRCMMVIELQRTNATWQRANAAARLQMQRSHPTLRRCLLLPHELLKAVRHGASRSFFDNMLALGEEGAAERPASEQAEWLAAVQQMLEQTLGRQHTTYLLGRVADATHAHADRRLQRTEIAAPAPFLEVPEGSKAMLVQGLHWFVGHAGGGQRRKDWRVEQSCKTPAETKVTREKEVKEAEAEAEDDDDDDVSLRPLPLAPVQPLHRPAHLDVAGDGCLTAPTPTPAGDETNEGETADEKELLLDDEDDTEDLNEKAYYDRQQRQHKVLREDMERRLGGISTSLYTEDELLSGLGRFGQLDRDLQMPGFRPPLPGEAAPTPAAVCCVMCELPGTVQGSAGRPDGLVGDDDDEEAMVLCAHCRHPVHLFCAVCPAGAPPYHCSAACAARRALGCIAHRHWRMYTCLSCDRQPDVCAYKTGTNRSISAEYIYIFSVWMLCYDGIAVGVLNAMPSLPPSTELPVPHIELTEELLYIIIIIIIYFSSKGQERRQVVSIFCFSSSAPSSLSPTARASEKWDQAAAPFED
eukprot:gene12115-8339_t